MCSYCGDRCCPGCWDDLDDIEDLGPDETPEPYPPSDAQLDWPEPVDPCGNTIR